MEDSRKTIFKCTKAKKKSKSKRLQGSTWIETRHVTKVTKLEQLFA